MKNKLIGIYQLITGTFGVLLLVFIALQKLIEGNSQILPSFALGLILFGGTAFSGYALIKQLKHGRKYSLWAQALQIIGFTYNGIQYLFTGSAFLALVIGEGVRIQTKLALIDYNIDRVSITLPLEVKIFVLPVILFLLLIKK